MSEPEPAAAGVCEYCGIEYDPETLHHIEPWQDDHWPVVTTTAPSLREIMEEYRDPGWHRGRLRRRLIGRKLDRVHSCRCACSWTLLRCGPCVICGR